MDDFLFYGNTEGTAEPITVEMLKAAFEKALERQACYEIVHPDEYKRRVRQHLKDTGREN